MPGETSRTGDARVTPPRSVPEGVPLASWEAIGAVLHDDGWKVPERSGGGEIVGWHVRRANGAKEFIPGGHRGLTLAWPLPSYAGSSQDNPIFVVEGASDTAALHALELVAVGRPSAHGGKDHLRTLLAGRHVCVVGEHDSSAGIVGAEGTASALGPIVPSVRVVFPPPGIKDAREWVVAGASRSEFLGAAASVSPWTPAAATASDDTATEWPVPVALFDGVNTPAFPIADAFPPNLTEVRDFLAGLSHELQVPVDMPAMLLLPIVAIAIAKKFEVEVRGNWREAAPIWALTLLDSGERKSGTFRRMTAPLNEWEREEAERLAPVIAEALERRELLERKRSEARRLAGEGDVNAERRALDLAKQLEESRAPHVPTLLTTEATSEGLAQMLVENGERAIVASPEADALDVLLGRYDDKARPNFGIWLAAYSGDRVMVRRRGRPPDRLERPALSVALCVQPEGVRGLFKSRAARGRGVLARFFFSVPRGMVGHRQVNASVVEERLQVAFDGAVRRLLDIPLDVGMGPRLIRLGPEAAALHLDFERRIELDLRRGGALGERREWGAKMCGGIARIALSLHCLGHSRHIGPEIDAATMRAALAWAPYLIAHERIAAGMAGCDPALATADRILAWLERVGAIEFSRRDCFSACRSEHVQTADDIDSPLELLEELGYIRTLPSPLAVGRPGRKPSGRFLVNPRWREGVALEP